MPSVIKAMGKNHTGKEDGGGNLSRLTKNKHIDKVTSEHGFEGLEGVRHVYIWAGGVGRGYSSVLSRSTWQMQRLGAGSTF